MDDAGASGLFWANPSRPLADSVWAQGRRGGEAAPPPPVQLGPAVHPRTRQGLPSAAPSSVFGRAVDPSYPHAAPLGRTSAETSPGRDSCPMRVLRGSRMRTPLAVGRGHVLPCAGCRPLRCLHPLLSCLGVLGT